MKIAHIHVWDKNNKGDLAIVLAVQEQLRQRFPGVEIEDHPMEILKTLADEEVARLNAADCIVMGGGGVLYWYFTPFATERIPLMTKPFFSYGVGHIQEMGKEPLSEEQRKSIAALAAHATMMGVRDYNTVRFLQELGTPQEKIFLMGDSAVLLQEQKVERQSDRPRIGYNLNYSGWLGFGKHQQAILEGYSESMKLMREKYDAEIFYLMHFPDEARIIKELSFQDFTVIDYPPAQQKGMYATLDTVVGMMLHSVVLAFGAGTPELNVAYDIRNIGFAEFIGHPELAIKPDELVPGYLSQRVEQVYLDRDRYRDSFQKKIAYIRARHSEYLDIIAKNIT